MKSPIFLVNCDGPIMVLCKYLVYTKTETHYHFIYVSRNVKLLCCSDFRRVLLFSIPPVVDKYKHCVWPTCYLFYCVGCVLFVLWHIAKVRHKKLNVKFLLPDAIITYSILVDLLKIAS